MAKLCQCDSWTCAVVLLDRSEIKYVLFLFVDIQRYWQNIKFGFVTIFTSLKVNVSQLNWLLLSTEMWMLDFFEMEDSRLLFIKVSYLENEISNL